MAETKVATVNLEKMFETIDKNYENVLEKSAVKVIDDNLTEKEKEIIKEKAKEFLKLLSTEDRDSIRSILEASTKEEVEELENSSALLSTKVDKLDSIEDSSSSGIAEALLKLNEEVKEINPNTFDFEGGKWFSWLPFVGKPIDNYLSKFKSAKSVINEIIKNLDEGENLLRNDIAVLESDKKRYRQSAIRLQRKAMIMEQVAKAIEENIANMSEKEREFYQNNLLLYIQKRIRSLYEILVVTQQGFLSSDVIINTNWELIDNVSNIKAVTKRALEIGVSMLVALENQKMVLDATNKTKDVTNDLVLGNAKRLNEQATEIYKQASQSTLSMETLKESFKNIEEAMNKMNTFKAQSLVKVKNEISQIKEVTDKLEEKMREVEKVDKAKSILRIDIDD